MVNISEMKRALGPEPSLFVDDYTYDNGVPLSLCFSI